jgi:hypothetical protein
MFVYCKYDTTRQTVGLDVKEGEDFFKMSIINMKIHGKQESSKTPTVTSTVTTPSHLNVLSLFLATLQAASRRSNDVTIKAMLDRV